MRWAKGFCLFISLFVLAIITTLAQEPDSGDPVNEFMRSGDFHGKVGAAFHFDDYSDDTVTNQGAAWGLLELQYRTAPLYGIRAGAWLVAANKIWEDRSGDYRAYYDEDMDLRNLYLDFTLPETDITLTGGRSTFVDNPALSGHAHQGAQVVITDVPHLSLSASVFERWIHHSTTFYNADGITGWQDVDDISDKAGKFFFTGVAAFQPAQALSIAPFFDHQEDVMTVYGCSLNVKQPVNEHFSWMLDGIYACYVNEVPDRIAPDYEDVRSWLLHSGISWKTFTGGLGWYAVSDDKGDITVGAFDSFDPMEDDTIIPAGDGNNVNLYYMDGSWSYAAFSVDAVFGYGLNESVDCDSRELDLWLTYNITSSLEWGGYFLWSTFTSDEYADYTRTGTALTYLF